MLGVVQVAPGTFFAIIAVSALAATIAATAGARGAIVPVVVLELLFGVLLGPDVLGLKVSQFVSFFAGYEIDITRIMGRPLCLG